MTIVHGADPRPTVKFTNYEKTVTDLWAPVYVVTRYDVVGPTGRYLGRVEHVRKPRERTDWVLTTPDGRTYFAKTREEAGHDAVRAAYIRDKRAWTEEQVRLARRT